MVPAASICIAVSVLVLVLMLVAAIGVGVWRRARVAHPVHFVSEAPEEAEEEWTGHVADSGEHQLSFDRNRPHSSMNSADTYVCTCVQNTCKGGTLGDRMVGVTESPGEGWMCYDEVFGTRQRRSARPVEAPPAEVRSSPLHAAEAGGPLQRMPTQWTEPD